MPPTPAFSENVRICPMREELQLTMLLARPDITPGVFAMSLPDIEG